MADTPLRGYNGRHEWFWEPGDDDKAVYPLENLMEMYEKSVGRNATLMVGLTPKAQPVNYCQIQEDISGGERIRAYRVEARVNGKWTTVAQGSSVGHKRIESFPAVKAKSFRLVVERCTAEPLIRNFSIYHVTN